ncbi:PucR family transcriptional regulator [Amycolatopsis sp. H20-H5]|uniref:PucR family transcriptional regulator n=1 Tax=Amycolatopsis sp. H20-H5 TaxID=3046309 RepID=UPI002DB72392|nr:helix-turn-helix domain-containing protein [Amycolatopsis sp. H20-H5]MEC3975531.1 helix-turn-helix domain-containing protein [Amycolatopsis sp. H20-H5]
MTSAFSQERATARLRASIAPMLTTVSAATQAACRELLDTSISVLTAAAAGEFTWLSDASARIRDLSAQIAVVEPGVDSLVRGLREVVADLLRLLSEDSHGEFNEALREVSATGGRLLSSLLAGAHAARGTTLQGVGAKGRLERARELLNGEKIALEDTYDLAPAYAVIATRFTGMEVAQVDLNFAQFCGEGVLSALGSSGGFVLLPAEDEARAYQLTERVHGSFSEPAWMAVSWRTTAEIVLGRREASKILSLVLATERQPGAYRINDVLVEYAVVRQSVVTQKLGKIIEPLIVHAALLDTLKVLIATDGNRSQAAEKLIIHRSTLDYRVQRIEQLTGFHPGGVRGINILSTAVAAHVISAWSERLSSAE